MNRVRVRRIIVGIMTLGVMMPAGMAAAETPVRPGPDGANSAESEAHDQIRRDAFRFGCRVDDTTRRPTVHCRWQPIESRRVAGYVVYRAQVRPDQLPREAVARVRAGDRAHVTDHVRPGTAWVYAAVAVGHDGQALAVSSLDRVSIPPES